MNKFRIPEYFAHHPTFFLFQLKKSTFACLRFSHIDRRETPTMLSETSRFSSDFVATARARQLFQSSLVLCLKRAVPQMVGM